MRNLHKASRGNRQWAVYLGVLSLGLLVSACSGEQARNLTGPSVVGGVQGHPGTGPRLHYKATISPTSVLANSTTAFTVVITNCTEALCGAGNGTTTTGPAGSPTGHSIKSVKITVPAGFTVNTLAVAPAGWTVNLVSGVIQVVKTGNTQLVPGQSVTVTFNGIASADCDDRTWTTQAFQDDNLTDSPFTLVGSQPVVTVTGCAAQACSPGFWKQDHHFGDWPASPQPGDTFFSVFARTITVGQPGQLPDVTGPTLAQALQASGGGVGRAARIGTAAYLSAVHPGVAYAYTAAEVITAVRNAIDGVVGPISIDNLENVWKDHPDHCPLGNDPGLQP